METGRDTGDDDPGEQAPVPGVLLVASGSHPGVAARRLLATGAALLVVGRSIAAAGGRVVLDDGRLSREHAAIERAGNEWVVRDLGSRNGTFVDGHRVADAVQVRGDAVVRCGHTVLLLLADARGHGLDGERDGDRGGDDVDGPVVGPELARVLAEVARHAGSPALLVQGERGTGKRLIARHYHDRGPRAGGPYVSVDCSIAADIGGDALLFGGDGERGLLERAGGGTVFLDRVDALDLAAQARLVAAIESREVATPAGPRPIDVGLVATSDDDLRGAVAARRFRNDLFRRLAHPLVEVPPLRHRRADIPPLVAREIALIDRNLAVHPRLIEACCLLPWPGNVPELQRAVREAATVAHVAGRDEVRPQDLPLAASALASEESSTSHTGPRARVSPAEVDREAVETAMAVSAGNVSAAARALGLHRTQLYRLLQRFGLDRAGDGTQE